MSTVDGVHLAASDLRDLENQAEVTVACSCGAPVTIPADEFDRADIEHLRDGNAVWTTCSHRRVKVTADSESPEQ